MNALSRVSDSPDDVVAVHDARRARKFATRRFPSSDGTPHLVVESAPSVAGRMLTLTSRMTLRQIVAMGSYVPQMRWPWGVLESAARIRPLPVGTTRTPITLPHASAELVRARGVLPARGDRRVVLYLHGGAFMMCGANTHSGITSTLSALADAPVLVVNYRLIPKHSIGMALDDCHDGYRWLRARGYQPDQIVLAGDSAGGYLALALAQRLQQHDEKPAAIVAISPLLQLDQTSKQSHPNIKTDAMFPAKAFDALTALVASGAAKHAANGKPEEPYEPLDHIRPGLPRTLIHVSGSEVLLHDAALAADKLAAAGVPVEMRVWPGQVHAFQVVAPMLAEAARSLRQIGEYIREATG